MLLKRWDPLFELGRMHHNMDRIWRGVPFAVDGRETGRWSIPLDAVEEGEKLVVRASLPGISPDDIKVTVEDGVLSINGRSKVEEERKEGGYLMRERRTGSFHRSLRLPDTADVDNAETIYDNGVLTITFGKVESKRAKHLTVTTGKALEGDKK